MSAQTDLAPQPLIGGLDPQTPLRSSYSVCVDWVAATIPQNEKLADSVYWRQLDQRSEDRGGIHGYTEGRLYADGRYMLSNRKRPEMGVHWVFSGGTLNNMAEYGCMAWHLIRQFYQSNAKFSRIDLALDLHNTAFSFEELEGFIEADDYVSSVRKMSRVTGVGDTGGYTLYIGSRQSELCARFYDKAAEQGIADNWIRLELELKGGRAQYAAQEIAMGSQLTLKTLIPGMLRGLIDFPNYPAWSEAITGEKIIVAKSQKKPESTKEWLLNTVASTIGRILAREGDMRFWDTFQSRVMYFKTDYEKRLSDKGSDDKK